MGPRRGRHDVKPAPGLVQVAALLPEAPDREREADRGPRVAGRGRTIEDRADVVVRPLELVEEPALLGAGEIRGDPLGERQEPGAVSRRNGVSLAALRQLLRRVGPNRVQHLEPRVAVRVDGPDQALVREGDQAVDDVHPELGGRPAHRLGCSKVDAALEDRDPVQQSPVALVEQVVAPGDRTAERLLPLGQVPRAGGEERELVLEPSAQGVRREQLDPRRGELDRERHAVEPRGDCRNGRCVLVRYPEVRLHRRRPRDEQVDRLVCRQCRNVDDALLGREARELEARELAQVRRRG